MTLLGFPGNPLPIRGEAYIDGAWTEITDRVRREGEITISARGRANEQGRPNPCTCDFMLNNRDGLFSDRNPMSPYFGKLPTYLPIRFSVTEDRSFAILDTSDGCEVKTTDKAVLDITAEIDIRIEVELDNPPDGVDGPILAAKHLSGGNTSWLFVISKDGYLQLIRSADGTSLIVNTCTVPLPSVIGPIAVRVTFDGNDGSGNRVHKFYTADTIAGSWTQLGATSTLAGTTALFSGTAALEIGRQNGGQSLGFLNYTGLVGRVYAFELYSGIASPTLVAEADIYNQARGTTSFSDGLGTPNTWTVEGTCEITPDNRRFTGELGALPPEWDVSGNDIYVRAQAADITRRLGKGAVPVVSPLTDYLSTLAGTAHFPCEDGTAATSLLNKVVGGARGTFTDVQFGTASDLPATAGTLTINSTNTRVNLTAADGTNTGYACFNWAQKMASIPGASVTLFNLKLTGGTIGTVNFSVTATTYDIAAYDLDGALLGSSATSWTTPTPPNVWELFRIQLSQSGGNVNMDLGWYHPGDNVLTGISTVTFAGTAGRFRTMKVVGATNNIGTQFAQFFFGQFFLDNTEPEYVLVANAFAGETTAARWLRVGAGNNIDTRIVGTDDHCEVMGAQIIDTPLNILYDCVETEQGQMYPDRNTSALMMRTHRSLINQSGPEIDYSLQELGPAVPRPIPDDALLRNSTTAGRADGSTGFHERTDGPKGTLATGVVPNLINRNPYESSRLDDLAAFDTFLGTWDEDRWTQVMVELARGNYTGTEAKVRKGHILTMLDIGDLFSIVNPPSHLPPDDIQLMMQGVTEVLGNKMWRLTWNTSPYGPYVRNDLSLRPETLYHTSTTTSTLDAGITTTATSFDVATPSTSRPWRVGSGLALSIKIGGEVMTVDTIGAYGSGKQAFSSVTRSVNGIVKTHDALDGVNIAKPFYLGL